jgi:hypothetical protein
MSPTRKTTHWDHGIDKAMKEIDGTDYRNVKTVSVKVSEPHNLPNGLLYGVIGLLLAFIIFRWVGHESPHQLAENRDFETGSRVALLMIAEDIERHRNLEGRLPRELVSPLGQVLDVEYSKLDEGTFSLKMQAEDGVLIFQDSNRTISMIGADD